MNIQGRNFQQSIDYALILISLLHNSMYTTKNKPNALFLTISNKEIIHFNKFNNIFGHSSFTKSL